MQQWRSLVTLPTSPDTLLVVTVEGELVLRPHLYIRARSTGSLPFSP